MREIKFRAWHEHNKKMVYGPTDDVVNPSWVLAMCSANKIEPMQYTGLKDKNEKEIYEGDAWKQGRSIGVIVFEEGQFIIDWRLYRDNWSNLLKFHWDVGQVIAVTYTRIPIFCRMPLSRTNRLSETVAEKQKESKILLQNSGILKTTDTARTTSWAVHMRVTTSDLLGGFLILFMTK